ncbi:MAG: hypothetical protein WD598_00650 [Acidimicrobiia bacterium]
MLGDAPGVVGELVGYQGVGDGVEFHGVDGLGVEVQRGQHFVATGRPDDQDLCGCGPFDREGEGAGVRVEAPEARDVAVEAVDGRAEETVVGQARTEQVEEVQATDALGSACEQRGHDDAD